VRESQPWAPTTAFGVAQRAVADLLGVYRARHAIEFTALALSAVYGPRQAPDRGPVAAFVDAARAGRPCRIEGDGRQTLDLLFVDDAVDALVRAALRGTGLVVNVGTGVQTTVRELERLVAGEGAPPPEHLPAPGHTGRFAVAPTRARIHLGWAPWTSQADAWLPLVPPAGRGRGGDRRGFGGVSRDHCEHPGRAACHGR
jgi:UDP-glucose 4-epimerase